MKIFHSLFLFLLVLLCSCQNIREETSADKVYKKAEKLYDNSNYDQAFIYFYEAYQGYRSEKKYTDAAYSLIFLAIIQTEKGDFLGSNENLSSATRLAGKDEVLLTSVYNQFAINHNFLKNNEEAIYWYDKALLLSQDQYAELSIKNNIGISYLKMGKCTQAESIFKEISQNPTIRDNINFRNRVSDNFAYAQFLSGKRNPAEREMLNILESRKNQKDRFGMTASLSHLADFYSAANPQKSYEFATAMYNNACKTGNSDDQLEALKKMINASDGMNSKPLFHHYWKLSDSLENVKNSSKNHFTSVIYESEKNKADILASKNKILNQQISILALVAFLGFGVILFLKWRKAQNFQKELAIKNTQLKYSKKVHDVVANGLYHMMVGIQNSSDFNKQNVLNSIEKLYEESRDIARDDLDSISPKDFSLRLHDMLASYSSDNNRVLIIGNSPQLWNELSSDGQNEIFYVLRELMVNMKKHSFAKFAYLKFEKTQENIHIRYTDNGIGMDISGTNKKSGLQNMENRIESLGGKFNFEPNPNGGLITDILIPYN